MSAIPKIDLQKIRVEDVYQFIQDLLDKLAKMVVLNFKMSSFGVMYTTAVGIVVMRGIYKKTVDLLFLRIVAF